MSKFNIGDKVYINEKGLNYLRNEHGYKELLLEYYTIIEVFESEMDGDFYILNSIFDNKIKQTTGFIENELEKVEL